MRICVRMYICVRTFSNLSLEWDSLSGTFAIGLKPIEFCYTFEPFRAQNANIAIYPMLLALPSAENSARTGHATPNTEQAINLYGEDPPLTNH